jgi:filamentous hemagglutinin
VLTFGGGDIAALVRDNFDVYRSRVFTVAGGDIHLWSSLGNIDAGRGPRDTAVAPPPRLVIDEATGIVTLDVSSSVSGSGIGALKTRDDQPASDIRLIAPNGFIDAGEAGIRADAGTVTLGTNIVLNAGNINAGGGVSGGAVVVSAPAPVPTATSAGQADKASEKAQQALAAQEKESEERAKKERRKRVVGEFIGFGEGAN